MQLTMIPTGNGQPINMAKVAVVSICNHYFSGQPWRYVDIFEDDLDKQERRILRVRLPLTPKGKIKKSAEIEAEISLLMGYDAQKHRWGDTSYTNSRHDLTYADGKLILDVAEQVAKLETFSHSGNAIMSTHYQMH